MNKSIALYFIINLLLFNFSTSGYVQLFSLNSFSSAVAWKVKSQTDVGADSLLMLKNSYKTDSWINAVVHGTVFSAYVLFGLEKDPNYGDNIYKVDSKKYDRNFWYRTEFVVPADFKGKKIRLNFDGINRDAQVYIDGHRLGILRGIMQLGKFDITQLVEVGKTSTLAVLISPASLNGFISCTNNQDCPTYISSGEWDWMLYVPVTNSGIQDHVYLTTTGPVTIVDPWIRTDLPDNLKINLCVQAELQNHSCKDQTGDLKCVIESVKNRYMPKSTLC